MILLRLIALATIAMCFAHIAQSAENINRYGRAPYPWFENSYSRSTSDAAFATPAWFDLDFLGYAAREANWGTITRLQVTEGFLNFHFNHARVANPQPSETSDLQLWRFSLGYVHQRDRYALEAGVGAAFFDIDGAYGSDLGWHLRTGARYYLFRPLSIEGQVDMTLVQGDTLLEGSVTASIQLYRPLMLKVGWRRLISLGDAPFVESDGLTFGLALSFGSIARMWADPPEE